METVDKAEMKRLADLAIHELLPFSDTSRSLQSLIRLLMIYEIAAANNSALALQVMHYLDYLAQELPNPDSRDLLLLEERAHMILFGVQK